jgi:hypothetical protein
LTLEHLEDTFYRQALSKYSEKDFADAGYDSEFYQNVKRISSDESEHVSFLTSALKGIPTVLAHPTMLSETDPLQLLALRPLALARTTLDTRMSSPSSPQPPFSKELASRHILVLQQIS